MEKGLPFYAQSRHFNWIDIGRGADYWAVCQRVLAGEVAQMDMPGNMIAFEVQGGKEAAFRLANRLEVIKISNNLGDAKSLITHPATTTHQRLTPEARAELGISDAMLRLSVGLEDAADLTEDLGLALDAA